MSQQTSTADVVDQAVAEGGAYEVLSRRLVEQGRRLALKAGQLNDARLAEFGDLQMRLIGRVNVRTENNCVSRDIVQVGDLLVFGYNVFIGLRQETRIEDVFALFRLRLEPGAAVIDAVPIAGTFLADPGFVKDFAELYKYYKDTRLVQLTVTDGRLLAAFQVGERIEDLRVFRWSVGGDGALRYIDNRGERDIELPPAFDFEWQTATRDDVVHGRHAHINVLDTVFVDTLAGDLTIKIENNTEDGLGVYREPVEDKTQALGDADVQYARVGGLVLLKIRPYKEPDWRYLLYNTLTEEVRRIDAIGESCVQLPEDHGLIFPGGCYLQTGVFKTFDEDDAAGFRFGRSLRSPNGEDVLYVFYRPHDGAVALLAYNLIAKELRNPLRGHGYALSDDGRLVIFVSTGEPTRVHPMQIWETPYSTAEYAAAVPVPDSFFGRIGNSELVRGVSSLFAIQRLIDGQTASARVYLAMAKAARRVPDAHHWIVGDETDGVGGLLREIAETADLAVDEFVKVEAIRAESAKRMQEAEVEQAAILAEQRHADWQTAEAHVEALKRVQRQRGHLATIGALRYVDRARIGELDAELVAARDELGRKTIAFLSTAQALKPYQERLDGLQHEIDKAAKVVDLEPVVAALESTGVGLDLLSELLMSLDTDDATVKTGIVDAISQLYARLNQIKAAARHRRNDMGSAEAKAQFAAQFKLFAQTIANALGLATTPERSDEQMARLLVQLEDMESEFGGHEVFLADILAKREEIYETFEAHKQQLLDERQRRAQALADAAERMLSSIERRALAFTEADDLNTYFASDPLVLKTQDLERQLRELGAAVKADDLAARLAAVRDVARRALRDKADIYEDGGKVIRMGPRHRFSVNTQELDLTIVPRGDALHLHLTGTDYYELLDDPELNALRDYWGVELESESEQVYRGEYLAAEVLAAAQQGREGLTPADLGAALLEESGMARLVARFAAPRYKEGYEKGIHDHDAAVILRRLLPALDEAGLLRYAPAARAMAQLFWASQAQDDVHATEVRRTWQLRARSAQQMRSVLASERAAADLVAEVARDLAAFGEAQGLGVTPAEVDEAARYLVAELAGERVEFVLSRYARQLGDELRRSLDEASWRGLKDVMQALDGDLVARWRYCIAWLGALTEREGLSMLAPYVPEAAALMTAEGRVSQRASEVDLVFEVGGLLGEHPRIEDRRLRLGSDTFLQRIARHRDETLAGYRRYRALRQDILERERRLLRPQEFKPRPLSSFVRNRLINEAYLPFIGDNLAKQIGALGDGKRTDLMGLLMMISPPGYGKTTLMEYVANRLGLIFMKINCPALGSAVVSLDPAQAPDATAARELHKLNLALEMGNNVMLYLDDIQHTNPEFLQKFISLSDATRRIEGVWKGVTKTYDMRGRKFCVVMAGNPYTESGEVFKVPDMLANRADVYNLGDILGGLEEQFALSYIENALTSNPVLAPLATRDLADLYRFVEMARGGQVATTDLSHAYSGAEINEITGVLQRLFAVQSIVLKINRQYIASAAQSERNRTEPPFKLQGSYRNMNKMAEKVSAVMSHDELLQMIGDHYLGEAQMLTSGAEENLLKLAELRGDMDEAQAARWQQIVEVFRREQAAGGSDADAGSRIAAQLFELGRQVQAVVALLEGRGAAAAAQGEAAAATDTALIEQVRELASAMHNVRYHVEVVNEPVPGVDALLKKMVDTLETSIYPLVHVMAGKLDIDLRTQENTARIFQELKDIRSLTVQKTTRGGRLRRDQEAAPGDEDPR